MRPQQKWIWGRDPEGKVRWAKPQSAGSAWLFCSFFIGDENQFHEDKDDVLQFKGMYQSANNVNTKWWQNKWGGVFQGLPHRMN
jgi:hypothetical protein